MNSLIKRHIASLLVLLVSSSLLNAAIAKVEGAKTLFSAQLDKPSENINTGIQYWIELHRHNTESRVNNKTVFRSGDKIRFHVKSNIDGYAYILLRSGSRGEQAVLFPDSGRDESNQVERGKDYVLPSDGFLKFDENPGMEKLSLMLSRSLIDTSPYISSQPESVSLPVTATIASGSKDLIPTKIVVSYTPSNSLPKAPEEENTAIKKQAKSTQLIKPANENNNLPSPESITHNDENQSGVTTVVYGDPSGVLAVDVSLEHR